jgi:hypothetical protein
VYAQSILYSEKYKAKKEKEITMRDSMSSQWEIF